MKNIIIFGAGYYGRQALLYYGQRHVVCFVDNNPDKTGMEIEEIPIISFKDYLKLEHQYETVVACANFGQIAEQLIQSGITEYTVFPSDERKHEKELSKWRNTQTVSPIEIERIFNRQEKTTELYVKKVLYVGDNTDTLNWGCRATSQALYDIISQNVTVVDVIRRNDILSCFRDTHFCPDVIEYYERIRKNDYQWTILKKRITNVDAVILNGEGSFIFRNPPRYDLHIYLCILLLCIEQGTPFYVLNAMFTDGTGYEKNNKLLNDTIRILRHASLVSARDPVSFDYLKKYDEKGDISLKYIPDALFSWYEFFNEQQDLIKNMLIYSKYHKAFDQEDVLGTNQIDFTRDYIILSGNSYVSAYPAKGIETFTALASELKKAFAEKNIFIYLAECCVGDGFLRQVSKNTGIPIIKVENNIYFGAAILQHALCFVSGRYHPSILASLGGTSCVYMGSNSHKTASLQEVLHLDKVQVYDPIPSDEEIKSIVSHAIRAISTDYSREKIKKICRENGRLAKELHLFNEENGV